MCSSQTREKKKQAVQGPTAEGSSDLPSHDITSAFISPRGDSRLPHAVAFHLFPSHGEKQWARERPLCRSTEEQWTMRIPIVLLLPTEAGMQNHGDEDFVSSLMRTRGVAVTESIQKTKAVQGLQGRKRKDGSGSGWIKVAGGTRAGRWVIKQQQTH